MSHEMVEARKLVELENRAKAAVAELGKVSMELKMMGRDIKLSGWDWERPSWIADILPQGHVSVAIVSAADIANRGKRHG